VRDLADYDRAFGLDTIDGRSLLMAAKQQPAGPDAVKQIHYLAAALKAPRITEAAARLADQARDAGWTHEDYLAAVLEREVSARNASGVPSCGSAGRVPARKTLEDFDWDAPTRRPATSRRAGLRGVPDRGPQRRAPRPARHRQNPPRHQRSASPPPTTATGSCSRPRSTGSPA
jgi:hypothetical protein